MVGGAPGLLVVPFVPSPFSSGSLVTVTRGCRGIWTSRTLGRSPSLELPPSDATDPDRDDSEGVSGTMEQHVPVEMPSNSAAGLN